MKNILVIAFVICCMNSFAQTKYNIQKAYSFSKLIMPGNIAVDESGNPLSGPRTEHLIILETKGSAIPQWKSATINGKVYSIATHPVSETSLQLGQQKSTERMVVIKPLKGNKLWQLELDPSDKAREINHLQPVLLKGTFGGKTVTYKIDREIELISPPVY